METSSPPASSAQPQPPLDVPVKGDRFLAKVAKAKRKGRSELEPDQWTRHNYAKDFQRFWDIEDTQPRIHHDEVSVEEFIERFEAPGLPVVIQGVTTNWPALQNWTIEKLVEKYGQYRFKCGEDDDGYGVYMKFKYYIKYALQTEDDSPLYIFDSSFGDRLGPHELVNDYELPKYFRDDLFRLAGEKRRPPYRWVVIGPARSGTNIHIDPLGTSAWNTLLSGHKRWALFPPTTPKALVDPPKMEDEAVVWFQRIYPQTLLDSWPGPKPMNIIQKPGETVFVPGGWWHVVMNLETTVAITQNFCSRTNFEQVWLKARSSRPKFSRKLAEKLRVDFPDLYTKLRELDSIPNLLGSSSSSSTSSSSEESERPRLKNRDAVNDSDEEEAPAPRTALTISIQVNEDGSVSRPSKASDSEGSDSEVKEKSKKFNRRKDRAQAGEEDEMCHQPDEKKLKVEGMEGEEADTEE